MKKQTFKNATLISYKALKNSLYGTPRYTASFRNDNYELLTGTTATYKKCGYTLLNFATVKADITYHVTAKGNIIIDEIKESQVQ